MVVNGGPRILLGAALLAAGQGGIARLARMTARALVDSGADVDLLSYLDDRDVEIAGRRARLAHAGKLRYALLAHCLGLRADLALYDSVGLARGHPRLPGARVPHGLWIARHGSVGGHARRPSGLRPARRSRARQFQIHAGAARGGARPPAAGAGLLARHGTGRSSAGPCAL